MIFQYAGHGTEEAQEGIVRVKTKKRAQETRQQ